jgi:hypothetical protein
MIGGLVSPRPAVSLKLHGRHHVMTGSGRFADGLVCQMRLLRQQVDYLEGVGPKLLILGL